MSKKNNIKISYEPDSDVLMWELSNKPIDFAQEFGNFIVHFSNDNIPVLIEVLEAKKFINQAQGLLKKKIKTVA